MAKWPYNTAAWQHLRLVKLSERPLCEACTLRGATAPASHVDHIISIANGGDPFPPLDGLMSLCPRCHAEKTMGIDRPGGHGIRFKGAGADGLPIDPTHPFFGPSPVAKGDTPSPDEESDRRDPALRTTQS